MASIASSMRPSRASTRLWSIEPDDWLRSRLFTTFRATVVAIAGTIMMMSATTAKIASRAITYGGTSDWRVVTTGSVGTPSGLLFNLTFGEKPAGEPLTLRDAFDFRRHGVNGLLHALQPLFEPCHAGVGKVPPPT